MVTEFAFTPIYTTSEMRDMPFMQEKVANINAIRAKKSVDLVASGGTALDPYTFDYLLLCNKICGASHYNMQMKIVVDTPADFKAWLAEKPTLAQQWKEANAHAPAAAPAEATPAVTVDSTKVVAQVIK
jgi:cytochrome c oxidase subunit 2